MELGMARSWESDHSCRPSRHALINLISAGISMHVIAQLLEQSVLRVYTRKLVFLAHAEQALDALQATRLPYSKYIAWT